jgi:hypothetical protein
LRWAAWVFLAGWILHNADHLRRGLAVLTPGILWLGSVSGIVSLVVIGLALRGSGYAPELAVAMGFGMAIGVSAVHLLPTWSVFSDSLPFTADAITWMAVMAEIIGGVVFGWVGLRALAPGR